MSFSSFRADDDHRFRFEYGGIEHPVFRDGEGPAVLLLHELPGMTPECLRLAGLIKDAGFRVYCPLLFGRPGRKLAPGEVPAMVMCVRREFNAFATHHSGPISMWLRALCGRMREENGGRGVGAIGMCLTGNVILALLVDDTVLAPVTCQPSLPLTTLPLGTGYAVPLRFPVGPSLQERKHALGLSPQELAAARERSRTVPILGYRFKTDPICPRERFDTLKREFGDQFRCREIKTGPQNPGNIPYGAHSVLTQHFVNEPGHPTRQALDEILAYFDQQLGR
jgi:dienelactone hydrolase